jgi:hypothetical protein
MCGGSQSAESAAHAMKQLATPASPTLIKIL